jgi:DnaK suppressor protein
VFWLYTRYGTCVNRFAPVILGKFCVMSSLSAKDELERVIADQIGKTDELIAALEKSTQPIAPDNAIGRLSRMEALNEKSVNEEALRLSRERLMKLHAARQRLDEPNFGICSRCGRSIAVERLLVMPESRSCVPCKQALTKK